MSLSSVLRPSTVTAALGTAAVLSVTLLGCSGPTAPEDSAPAGQASQSAPGPASEPPGSVGGVGSGPLDGLEDDHGARVPGAGTDATAAARYILATWARPQVAADTWWGDLEPMLSASAQQAYAWTAPASLPALQVLAAQIVDAPEATVTFAVVDVQTTSGTVRMNMTRTTPQSGWVMDRMDLSEVLSTVPGLPSGEAPTTNPADPADPDQPLDQPTEGPVEFEGASA